MAITPWLTSNQLIESVKRKISMPIAQGTLSPEDILAFASEELFISQVPSVMQFHEEFFVWTEDVTLVPNKKKYEIPDRAIGMKLRDLFYKDNQGNLFEMTRIAEDDKSFFQRTFGTYQMVAKYYLQGNEIILSPDSIDNPTGSLNFSFFLRPNSLVPDERAAIIDCFVKMVTVDNATIVAGDILTINSTEFEAVASSPTGNQFLIGASSLETAANLSTAITNSGIVTSSSVGSPATTTVSICYSDLANTTFDVTSSTTGLVLASTQGVQFLSIPENIVNSSIVDFLQTKGGHSMRAYGVTVPSNGISGNVINFVSDDVPTNLVIGDYICIEHECIIPQIPSDLHSGLAERTCARILAAIGDAQGLEASNQKIAEIEARTGTLVDNRVEGSLKKVINRHGLLSSAKMSYRRRW